MMTQTDPTSHRRDRLLKLDEVMQITALGRSTIYARVSKGTFPRPVAAGAGSVRWRESAIDGWLQALPEALSDAA
jgi:prophage regulatory protein